VQASVNHDVTDGEFIVLGDAHDRYGKTDEQQPGWFVRVHRHSPVLIVRLPINLSDP